MNSTIMVNKSVKETAAKKAKKEGFSLSTVTKILLQDYAEGRVRIGSMPNDAFEIKKIAKITVDSETQKSMDNAVKTWRHKFAN